LPTISLLGATAACAQSTRALSCVPDDISLQTVAALLTKGLTAWAGLHGYYQLQPGQTVLVQCASSAVGSLLALWASSLGARVIGTASDPCAYRLLQSLLSGMLFSRDPALALLVREQVLSGVDVVYEFVGKTTFAASVAAVRDRVPLSALVRHRVRPRSTKRFSGSEALSCNRAQWRLHLEGRLEAATSALFTAYRAGTLGSINPRSTRCMLQRLRTQI
jgi:NADPH2:quinone reductase